MSEAENKTIAQRFNDEVWDKGDEAALVELFAEDVVDHGAIPGQPPAASGTSIRSICFAVPSPTCTSPPRTYSQKGTR